MVLLFLLALILVGKLFGFLGNLAQSDSVNNQKHTSWDGESPFNLVFKMDNIYSFYLISPRIKV